MQTTRGDRAVVLGGSMAGLLAARVLADAYAEVVVVERDELPHAAAHRRGVPQSRHIHGLLAGGQQALEELFDGLTAELVDLGAPAGDLLERPPGLLRGSPTATWSVGPAGAAGEPADARGAPARASAHAAVRGVHGPVRCRRTHHHIRWRPRHRRAGGPKTRRQRGADPDRGSGRGRHRPRFTHPGLARDARIPASAGGSGPDRHRVRQPDLPARPRTARRTTWESSTRRHPIIRAAAPSQPSRTIASSSPCSASSATTRRPIPRASPTSPPPCSSRTSTKPCATQNRSTNPSRSGTPPACDTATNGSPGFPTASW